MRTALLAVFLGATSVYAAKPPSVEAMIAKATAAVADGSVDPARDFTPLLDRLVSTKNASEQNDIIRMIEALGEWDAYTPAMVKTWLRENAPASLLTVAKSKTDKSVREHALMVLRDLNVSDAVFDEAIAMLVLFYANFSEQNYAEGLSLISKTLSFFQQTPWFTHANLPELDPGIDKLAFELMNLDLAELNLLFGMMGARYLPSVYYKVRVVPFQTGA